MRELAARIAEDYAGKELTLVCILKGAVLFAADLLRALPLPVEIDFMAISSYGRGVRTSGVVRILKDLDHSIEGKHVLVVEDIVDSGLTLSYLLETLSSRQPASMKVCVLLDKPERRVVDLTPTTSVSRYRTSSSSVTASTTRRSTVTCPSSGC